MKVNEVVDLLSVVEQPVSLEALVNRNEEAVYALADNYESAQFVRPLFACSGLLISRYPLELCVL